MRVDARSSRLTAWLPAVALGGLLVVGGWALVTHRLGGPWFWSALTVVEGGGLAALVTAARVRERRSLREYEAEEEIDYRLRPVRSEDVVDPDVWEDPRETGRAAFEGLVARAVESIPDELREHMSNVEIVVEDEPPPGQNILGLYHGHPLTGRTSGYVFARPDKISIYRGPLERHFGYDPLLLEREVRHTVVHEIAHHFGISDERLIEIDRY